MVEHMVLEPLPTPGDGSALTAPDSPPDSPTSPTPGVGSESTAAESPSTPGHSTAESSTPADKGVEFVTPPSRYASLLDGKDDHELEHRFRTLQNVLDAGPAMEPNEALPVEDTLGHPGGWEVA